MTAADRIVLSYICKVLNKEYVVNQKLFYNANWEEVIDIATIQGVLGLCFDAVELLPVECRPDMESLMEWLGQTSNIETYYEEHRKAITDLCGFYDDNGIKMMLLKGYGLSKYWPKPNHRPIGDIDIYLQDKRGKLVVDSNEFLWVRGDRLVAEKLGIKVETGHEHHTTFYFKGIMVENHYDFINIKAHKDASKIEKKLKSLADREFESIKIEIGGKTREVRIPSVDFNVIFLIRHLGQHFAGERISLRQLLDWGLFIQNEQDNINWINIIPFLKEMEIWTFFNQINAICVHYLGITMSSDLYKEEKPELMKRIVNDIFHPEFSEDKPAALLPIIWFKTKRWWYNRWKHPLVYKEWLLPMFITLLWSHIRRIKTIKDG